MPLAIDRLYEQVDYEEAGTGKSLESVVNRNLRTRPSPNHLSESLLNNVSSIFIWNISSLPHVVSCCSTLCNFQILFSLDSSGLFGAPSAARLDRIFPNLWRAFEPAVLLFIYHHPVLRPRWDQFKRLEFIALAFWNSFAVIRSDLSPRICLTPECAPHIARWPVFSSLLSSL